MSTKRSKPTTNRHCFAHCHMTCRQYGLWTRIRELQSKFGFVYFDGDDLSKSFNKGLPTRKGSEGTSRDAIYDDCNYLLETGWFQLVAPRCRKKDGTWEARKLTALSHKEWAAKFPDKCMKSQDDQLAQSDWDHMAHSDQPLGSERLTSRLRAIDHLAQSDKDLILTADLIQSRRDSNQHQYVADVAGARPDPSERKPADNANLDRETFLYEQRMEWDAHNESCICYKATTAHEDRALALAEKHGLEAYLDGIVLWLRMAAETETVIGKDVNGEDKEMDWTLVPFLNNARYWIEKKKHPKTLDEWHQERAQRRAVSA